MNDNDAQGAPDKRQEELDREEQIQKEEWQKISFRWMGIGIEFLVVVGIFSGIGYFLDKKSNTSPGFLIFGFFIGFITMLYTMIKRAGGIKWK
ncbi:MAG: AtpZ/AtpI family protein [Phycisphaerae bacterium]|nr:AtpZ/AtpI family protein [Phycisphaerae bacterium]